MAVSIGDRNFILIINSIKQLPNLSKHVRIISPYIYYCKCSLGFKKNISFHKLPIAAVQLFTLFQNDSF